MVGGCAASGRSSGHCELKGPVVDEDCDPVVTEDFAVPVYGIDEGAEVTWTWLNRCDNTDGDRDDRSEASGRTKMLAGDDSVYTRAAAALWIKTANITS